MKKLAFTLAEVLVTLGIIGVVSAMTVPSLMNHYQRQTYVTQMHKVYTEMSQALLQYQTEHNAVNLKEAGLNSQEALDDFIKSSFKVIQDCEDKPTPCFASSYKKMSGVTAGTKQPNNVVIASGASLAYGYNVSGDKKLAIIDVDINGAKGPNIAGRDVFIIGIFNNGMIDDWGAATAPETKDVRETLFNDNCNSASGGWYGCFGKLLNDNWQMNY